jgi:hypothetical protein
VVLAAAASSPDDVEEDDGVAWPDGVRQRPLQRRPRLLAATVGSHHHLPPHGAGVIAASLLICRLCFLIPLHLAVASGLLLGAYRRRPRCRRAGGLDPVEAERRQGPGHGGRS